jgi:hypothetical protein
VLKVWKGLGYNRRAFFLKRIASAFVEFEKQGINIQNPKSLTYDLLLTLPGIGQSTAGAVMAFAHNIGIPFIETNIRSIYLAHFFSTTKKEKIPDADIVKKIKKILQAVPKQRYRDWYYALYDYGSMLKAIHKKEVRKISAKSTLYKKQSTFIGSSRQLRAYILHTITSAMPRGIAHTKLCKQLQTYMQKPDSPFLHIGDSLTLITQILTTMEQEQQIVGKRYTQKKHAPPANSFNNPVWYISDSHI